MSEIDNENIDSQNDDDVSSDDTSEDSTDDTDTSTDDDTSSDGSDDDSSGDDSSEDVEKLKEQNRKLFERAKKAEGFEKDKDGNWVKKQPKSKSKPEAKAQQIEITPLDTIALMKAEVTDAEDINEILDYARFKNITVAEALKSSVVKSTLADRKAERETAQATATKGGKKGTSTPDADTLLQQASEGKFPDDPSLLAKARMEQKKSKK